MISLTYSRRRLIHIAFTSNRLSTITETANCLTKHSTTKTEYSVEPLIAAIDDVLKNQYSLIADDVFTEKEIHILKSFKESAELLKLPYLDTLSRDRNIAHENVDFPKEPVNDLVKGNYKSAIKRFIEDLKNMICTFEELKPIESLEYKMK